MSFHRTNFSVLDDFFHCSATNPCNIEKYSLTSCKAGVRMIQRAYSVDLVACTAMYQPLYSIACPKGKKAFCKIELLILLLAFRSQWWMPEVFCFQIVQRSRETYEMFYTPSSAECPEDSSKLIGGCCSGGYRQVFRVFFKASSCEASVENLGDLECGRSESHALLPQTELRITKLWKWVFDFSPIPREC